MSLSSYFKISRKCLLFHQSFPVMQADPGSIPLPQPHQNSDPASIPLPQPRQNSVPASIPLTPTPVRQFGQMSNAGLQFQTCQHFFSLFCCKFGLLFLSLFMHCPPVYLSFQGGSRFFGFLLRKCSAALPFLPSCVWLFTLNVMSSSISCVTLLIFSF